ncbi:MAG: DUF134 domain-containing protein, partial [Spirochaetales bacterium]|nr:DUF134 domain-containing protein [Spirochaetales bacterium]
RRKRGLMAKPKKDRRVESPPAVVYFKPQGIPMVQLSQVVLHVDEYEAIRLVDREKLDQEQAAERMEVSRATCARILESAHHKIAEALVQGKAIRIEGGSFILGVNRYRCLDCGAVWEQELSPEHQPDSPVACPRCKSTRVLDFARQAGWRPGSPWEAGGTAGPAGRGRQGNLEVWGGA